MTFHTLPFGSDLLETEIGKIIEGKSTLGRENLMIEILGLTHANLRKNAKYAQYETIVTQFFELITDSLLATTERYNHTLIIKNMFFSGGLFLSPLPHALIRENLEKTVHKDANLKNITDTIAPEMKISSDYVTVYGLALIASDLLLLKKDPLIRILRYVLYQYE